MSEPTSMCIEGQITIPCDVRKRLGLQTGDKIAWSLLSNADNAALGRPCRQAGAPRPVGRHCPPDASAGMGAAIDTCVLVRVLVQDPTAANQCAAA